MRKNLLPFLLVVCSAHFTQAQAPDFSWAKQANGDNVVGYGIAVDVSGNSYVTGHFKGNATFGNISLNSDGDVFVAKYDAAGNGLWANKAGGIGNDYGNAIAVGANGNSYVTGYFNGSATFGSTTLISSGSEDIFITKYDAAGNVLWAKRAGGTGNDIGQGIAVDANDNIYVTGIFSETATFGSETLYSIQGTDDIFVAKYDAAGNVIWAKGAGGIGSDFSNTIAVDGSGNSYVTGFFFGSAYFGNITLTSNGVIDIFIAKYDAAGNVLWASKAGGTGVDKGYGIAVDDSGNSYVTGFFAGTANFGSIFLSSSGAYDIFIAKYDAAGNPVWVKRIGGTYFEIGHAVAVDASGNSYVTGYFEGSVTFGSTTLTSSGVRDIFITKYDASGNPLWAKRAGGSDNGTFSILSEGYGIGVDVNGNSYLTGLFNGSADFGSTTLVTGSPQDMFIAKVNATVTSTASVLSIGSDAATLYPNPAQAATILQYELPQPDHISLWISDCTGRIVHSCVVDEQRPAGIQQESLLLPSHLSSGLYLIHLNTNSSGNTVKRLEVIR